MSYYYPVASLDYFFYHKDHGTPQSQSMGKIGENVTAKPLKQLQ
jgi:hypothetical protein